MLQLSPEGTLRYQIFPETRCKKLVLVFAISTQVTKAGKKTELVDAAGTGKDGKNSNGEYPENLAQVPCIRYPITFWKKSLPVLALFNSDNKVNAIHLTFTKELGLFIRDTDLGAQKIDSNILDTYEIVLAAYLVMDKVNRVRFFKETFLVANISPKAVFGMFFLTLNNADIDFLDREFRWRTYIIREALPTTRRVKLVSKKEFVTTVLDLKSETFVVHVASFGSDALPSFFSLNIYPSRKH